MAYGDGFVIAVPTANKQKFIDHARQFDPVLMRMDPKAHPMPFDGARMIYGGFAPVVVLER